GLALLALPLVLVFIDTEHAGNNPSTKPWWASWCYFGSSSVYDYQAPASNAEFDVGSGVFRGCKPSWVKPETIIPIAGKNGSVEEAKPLKNTPKYVK
ncbi:unnamed protein product, partial [Laminaria digitata]